MATQTPVTCGTDLTLVYDAVASGDFAWALSYVGGAWGVA